MRVLGSSLLGLLAAALVACSPAPAPTSSPSAPLPRATETPQPAPSATATRPVEPAAQGPLTADGMPITKVIVPAGAMVRYGLLGPGLARSDDAGSTWRKVSDQLLPPPLVSPGDPEVLYAGDMASCFKDEEAPVFRRSTDGGASWQELPAARDIRPVAALAGEAADTLYGISCRGVSVSDDGGESWRLTGPTLDANITGILPVIESGSLRLLAVLTSEGGTSHLAWFGQDGKLEQDMIDGLNFWGRGALARSGSRLYVATSTGVWRRDESGGGWQQFTEGLADVILKKDPLTDGLSEEDAARRFGLLSLAPDPLNPQRLALGTAQGLYISTDGGEQWERVEAPSLTEVRVEQVTWEPTAPGTLYAATPGGVQVVQLPL